MMHPQCCRTKFFERLGEGLNRASLGRKIAASLAAGLPHTAGADFHGAV
jgi:hypothetical protein